ncbi:MAG: 16S rRNA (adenine(1518)-N(6)/adenine(1519)-N(6))-dimethyltransferase RsmA [Pyrinomonadaceae bacterium]
MRAKKSLGQNFLRDDGVVKKIVDALDLHDNELVIEIGPGQGALTVELLKKAGKVIAIEFDRDLIEALRVQFSSFKDFELINEDALSVDFAAALRDRDGNQKIKLVANLPYNISTPILQRLIAQREIFSAIVLMFQREVVERITARPGTKNRGFLSVMVEDAFHAEYLFDVAPKAFQPVPKVWSAVVRLTPKVAGSSDRVLFRKMVSVSFAQRRKTILNNLKPVFENAQQILSLSKIDPKRRAETLTLDEWNILVNHVAKIETSL